MDKTDAKLKFEHAYFKLQQLSRMIELSSTNAQGGLTMADIYDEIDNLEAEAKKHLDDQDSESHIELQVKM